MEINRGVNDNPSDIANIGQQSAQTLHGETSRLTALSPLQPFTGLFGQMDLIRKFGQEFWRPKRDPASGLMLLSPAINPWTAEEDELLRMAVQRYKSENFNLVRIGGVREPNSILQIYEGKNWEMIAECFKDRTDFECLLRWGDLVAMDIANSPWSKEEDDRMIRVVRRCGEKRWSTLAGYFPGRTGKQCQERWHNHIIPNMDIEAWTQEEEFALIGLHRSRGNNWAGLSKYFPGRTDKDIENHWNSCVEKKLDTYIASGLIVPQSNGPSLVSRPNLSAAASSSPMVFIENHFRP